MMCSGKPGTMSRGRRAIIPPTIGQATVGAGSSVGREDACSQSAPEGCLIPHRFVLPQSLLPQGLLPQPFGVPDQGAARSGARFLFVA
jgi:hypothetical protein